MKNKFTKIIIYIILLIIVFMVSFNYILFKNFNLNNILNVNKGNYTQYNISYDKLIKNESIKFSEPNILNIVSCDYKVNVNNLNLKIKDFSIETNDNNINYKIVLYTKNGKKIVKYSNDFIKISKKTKSVYVNDEIKKIKIDAQYEIYDRKYSPSKNAKIIRVGKININSQKNRNLINKISLIKSLFVTIIFILIMLILKFISKIKDNKLNNINIYKSFLFFSIFFGIIFSILMPLYQTPDELTHINMIYQELNYKNIDLSDNFRNYADMSNVVRNVKRKVNVDKYFDLSKRINIKPQLHIPKISIIRHLPQAIGLIISMILNLPIFITITLCETLAVLLYSFVCYKALKLMPFKKYVLAFIMLLPISIQQFSSFSYDATLNCFCFIFIAYILHIKYVKEQFDIMDFLKLIGIALIIAVTKIPYVLLFLLILLIPLKKYNFNLKFIIIDYQYLKKHKKSIIIILCIFLPILLYFVYKVLTKIIIGKILLCTIRHPIISYKLIRQTTNIFFGNYILTLIGKLSWFDVILDNWYIFLTAIMFIIIIFYIPNKEEEIKFNIYDILIILVTIILLYILITISLFGWTLDVYEIDYSKFNIGDFANYMSIIPYIGGVQGRYFIPLLPLITLIFSNKKISNKLSKLNFNYCYILYYVVLVIYIIYILLNRFWIA